MQLQCLARKYKIFVDTNFNKTFLHRHSFSANPVACAAALSSLNLFNEDKTFTKIEEISKFTMIVKKISKLQNISKIRKLGTIAAFDFKNISDSYGSLESLEMRKKFLENGCCCAHSEIQFIYATLLPKKSN